MADITIDSAVDANHTLKASHRTLVSTSTTVKYFFFVDSDADFKYYKTTDGGQNWAGPTTIFTGTVAAIDCWFDKWTPGDSGTKIHCAYWRDNTGVVGYRSLDTASDTLGTDTDVETVVTNTTGVFTWVSITKAQGGNLYIAYGGDDGLGTVEHGFERSTDGGATWALRTTLWESNNPDPLHLYPADTTDNQDIAAIFVDASANAISLKMYDDSANSWTETAIGAMVDHSLSVGRDQFAGSIRLSDQHLILAFHNDRDTATADLKVYDLTLDSIAAPTVTAKTDIATNKDDMQSVVVTIDQNTDDIYVGYIGKSDGSETLGTSVGVYYAKSTDDGGSWSVDNVYSDTVTNNNATALYGSLGGTNFLVTFAWFENTDDDIFYNYANRVTISGTVSVEIDSVLDEVSALLNVQHRHLAEIDSTLDKVTAALNVYMQPGPRISTILDKLTALLNVQQSQLVTVGTIIRKVTCNLNVTNAFLATIDTDLDEVSANINAEMLPTATIQTTVDEVLANVNVGQTHFVTVTTVVDEVQIAITIVNQTLVIVTTVDEVTGDINIVQTYQLTIGSTIDEVQSALSAGVPTVGTIQTTLREIQFATVLEMYRYIFRDAIAVLSPGLNGLAIIADALRAVGITSTVPMGQGVASQPPVGYGSASVPAIGYGRGE